MNRESPRPTAAQEETTVFAPREPHERILSIDILRGFALFGILLINLMSFAYPGFLYPPLQSPNLTEVDRAVEWTLRMTVQASFYTIFSFLFGLGFALQLRRLEERGGLPAYARRLFVLFVFGALHSVFVWTGDILHTYAIVGFLLLPFRGTRGAWLLIWGALGIAVATYVFAAGINLAAMLGLPRDTRTALVAAYGAGSYLEVTEVRLRESVSRFFNTAYGLPRFLALFMLGMWVGRHRIVEHAHRHVRALRVSATLLLIVGFALKAPHGYDLLTRAFDPDTARLARSLALNVGGPAIGIGYAAVLALLLEHAAWQRRLAPLGAVGRMALTNYLLQSVVCTIIFYGYGLGLFGTVGTTWTTAFAVALFALQIPLSVLWLERFRYGPMEWLWRTLTYGRPPPRGAR